MVVNPRLIVADEPTSALDVSIQADILRLMEELQATFDLSIVFISHDMGVIREVSDHVAVMYLGEIVEIASTEELFDDPQHPYTKALLSSIPDAGPAVAAARRSNSRAASPTRRLHLRAAGSTHAVRRSSSRRTTTSSRSTTGT
ncbi:MAG: ABC transporter ATP-binding protein [Halobacteriales archaeon]|nr:ABC transporter ATP-binding protein [Halobacteriales archaeon]